MSYDIAAFDVRVAPREPDEFVGWYEDVMDDETEPGGVDPSSALGRWCALMQNEFPDGGGDDDGGPAADYSSSYPALVYVAGGWGDAEEIRAASLRYARSEAVGVFALSDDVPALWWPDGSGGLELIHEF
ncbi:hypothetical protein HH308_04565 [Gordonia sp. TBRC 11910]|uniref:Uncharacterized protein n=1 Tax=Gordonia asplenii TaxID=2725283 RepID=A0A848KP82_9ACTN|nr:hypothetical protein [Gordonia asplenii]NMO00486.1 hypothetical protein [Gordonia asplenii]